MDHQHVIPANISSHLATKDRTKTAKLARINELIVNQYVRVVVATTL
jgi:hypothetical protein